MNLNSNRLRSNRKDDGNLSDIRLNSEDSDDET